MLTVMPTAKPTAMPKTPQLQNWQLSLKQKSKVLQALYMHKTTTRLAVSMDSAESF